MNTIIKASCALAFAGCVVTTAAPGPGAAAASFTGTWSFGGSLVSGSVITKVNAVCKLKQSGDALSGSCTGANGGGPATGNVNANRVQLQIRVNASNAQGLTATVTFHGALGSDGAIRGTWTISTRPGSGTFNAVRA